MRIAVSTDFSDRSRKAFYAAASLARKFSGSLYVVHHAQPGLFPSSFLVSDLYESLDRKLSDLIAGESAFQGLDAQPLLVRGGNVRYFAESLEANDIDLLILATHGHTGVKRFLLGSFAERAIRLSPCPVLVCRPAAEEMSAGNEFAPRRILVACDFSAQGRVAIDFGHSLVRAFSAQALLLHVVNSECGITGFEIELFRDWHEFHAQKKKEAEQLLEELVSETWGEVQAGIQVTIGHPVLEILAEEKRFGADLIVMGTHGGSYLERYMLGSVAEKIVRKASGPVLLVREPRRLPTPS